MVTPSHEADARARSSREGWQLASRTPRAGCSWGRGRASVWRRLSGFLYQVRGRGIPAPRCVPDPAGQKEGGDAEYHVSDADEQKIGPNLTVRGRIDHD